MLGKKFVKWFCNPYNVLDQLFHSKPPFIGTFQLVLHTSTEHIKMAENDI